jgi:hypothetical protein
MRGMKCRNISFFFYREFSSLTRTRMPMHDRTTKIHCLRWDGDMFVGSNDRLVSFMTCYGNLKMLFGRNSSSSIQIKTSYRWKRKRERDRTNLRNENLCKKICTINTIAVLVASFHFNSLFILVSLNFTLLSFLIFSSNVSPMHPVEPDLYTRVMRDESIDIDVHRSRAKNWYRWMR